MKLWETFKQWSLTKKILVVLALLFILSFAQFLLPTFRTGPFGTGLPSSMKTLAGDNVVFTIDYPLSWVANELPYGNHGDLEVFAAILNPGNWMPSVWFARHEFQNGRLSQVAEWGESRILEKGSQYSSITLTETHTKNYEGLIRQYSWASESLFGSTNIRCEDIYILENGIGYAISFCSYERDWDKVEPFFSHMIESFDLR